MSVDKFSERIAQQLKAQRPFVLYSDFNQTQFNAIFQNSSKAYQTSEFDKNGFVFAPFDLSQPTYIIPDDISEHTTYNLPKFKDSFFSSQIQTTNAKAHKKLIKKAIQNIFETNLEKVVLARSCEIEFSILDPIGLFYSIANAYTEAYTYCWFHPSTGFWFGASPESLVKISGNKVQLVALAGTQRFKGQLEVNWDSKNTKEQSMVTDYLKSSLSKHLSSLSLSQPKTIRSANLLHLQTTLTGHLNKGKHSLRNLLWALHPTPAVCGTPKESAMAFIKDNETLDRQFYSGFLGTIKQNSSGALESANLVVNLRCMQLIGKKSLLYAGGGITNQSTAEMEWEETEAKIQTLKSIF